MKLSYQAQEISTVDDFHDSHWSGLEWREPETLVLSITWLLPVDAAARIEGHQTLAVELVAESVSQLCISVDWKEFVGTAMIYRLEVTPSGDGWQVFVEFLGAPDGTIRFQCDDVILVVLPGTLPKP